jgi:integrase
MNSIALPWKKIKRGIKRTNPHKDRAYTREEIKLLLSHVGLRLHAIILLLSSSGVRVGALPALKLGHLTKIEQHSLYMLTVYADEPEQYFTFTTPEAAEAIDQYLAHRKRAGEAMTPESPLFRDEFNCEIVESAQAVKPLSVYDIKNLIRAATHRAGIRVNKRNLDPTIAGSIRHEVKQVHGFRKYFYTCLRTSNVDPIICEMLVGHRTGSIRDGITSLMLVYDRPDKSQLLAEYLKAVERLAIGDEKKLEAQISQLQLQKEQETANADAIAVLSDKLIAVMQELEELKGQNKN